ncbi:MAG: AAA family ATPase [Patescibacteria group bacterium]|nr:AAA family ATPase [Patescibacteria group bacterium]
MYLEKLKIQGFKSFANKNTLVFPGMVSKSKRGITAIVGPNGAGKSNTADAVRWALGEQSMKILRCKKSEDVIFSGSDKKGRLGVSEVSLYFNNENSSTDSAQGKSPADYSQIALTRRLFRDGDSEYLINNSRVRLYDIQMLLAKAKFGQRTYSVIGQGMVEGFLNTSLAERKEFFDEATGVKQFQIKRNESLNKLRSSHENLGQAQMLLSEIEPRLKSLTRQVNKLQKREEIESELKKLQLNYYSKIWHEINNKFSKYNQQFLALEQIKRDKGEKLSDLSRKLSHLETNNKDLAELNDLQRALTMAQSQKDMLTKQLAGIEARVEIKLEANGQFDLSWLSNKKGKFKRQVETIKEEINMLFKNIEPEKSKLKKLENEKKQINDKINQLNEKLASYNFESGNKTSQNIQQQIEQSLVKLKKAEQEFSIHKVKIILKEIKQELEQIISISQKHSQKENLELLQQNLIKLTEDKEKIIININETNLRISARSERTKLLLEQKSGLLDELANIKSKLKQYDHKISSAEVNKQQKQIKEKILDINQKIIDIKGKISAINAQEQIKKNQLFDLQKHLQSLQNEINGLNNQLNEIKINSTRYETKLEGLEVEIRHNFNGLKEIKKHKVKAETEASLEKIDQLKRQSALIGSIDPEIEKEYKETKERYDFLSGQANDLSKAINSLEQIMKELDSAIKEKFNKEFKIIQAKFEEYFKILFHGGKAKIIKVMDAETADPPADPAVHERRDERGGRKQTTENNIENIKNTAVNAEFANAAFTAAKAPMGNKIKSLQKHNTAGLAGIEIQATPPGKKITSINMLSGGERALTAIALICAIISANPSPFVVLDEVDAALDEANSERFAKIIDDLSHKTQFIAITHNRATMRRANILYGVTMSNDSVSKLLSIKLEDKGK